MTTRKIANALAAAAQKFPLLGEITERSLLDVVRWELGHEDILDGFHTYAGQQAMAVGPGKILHIISGNTPHAGLQSLIRGLLLKAHNFCKIPSAGLPELAQFRDLLPDVLKQRVEISTQLPPEWLRDAGAIIVFGDDDTVEHFRKLSQPGQIFAGHGHKVSLGIVFEDRGFESVPHAARDASLFDQQGCLSPHLFYVGGDAEKYASLLASEMEAFNAATPRSEITAAESAAIAAVRNDFAFRAANGSQVKIWKSAKGTDWTVIFDADTRFVPSPLNRVIFVKPLPDSWEEALSGVQDHLGAISIWPSTAENAERVARLGATRICRTGCMQTPHFTWHQDGAQTLAPFVRWIDYEP